MPLLPRDFDIVPLFPGVIEITIVGLAMSDLAVHARVV